MSFARVKVSTKFTHKGDLLNTVSTADLVVDTVKLRKIGKYWIDEKGRKFSLKTGYDAERAWGLVRLDITSIKKIEND